ncbi:MAG: cation:proton antiporter subunit C [Halorhabdus sp.]
MIDVLLTHGSYLTMVLLLGVGMYVMIRSPNLVKKVVGLNVFQTGIFLFFISSGYVDGGKPPLVGHGSESVTFVSPLPHVLILTAIVVGVSLTAVALALIVRIYREYGTLQEDVLREVIADE